MLNIPPTNLLLLAVKQESYKKAYPLTKKYLRFFSKKFCQKRRWQVIFEHAYTLDSTKSEFDDDAAVQAQCGNLSG